MTNMMEEQTTRALGVATIQNTTDHQRTDVVRFVHPFPEGAWDGVAGLVSGTGEQLQAYPMGAKWPDGSTRFAIVHAPVELDPEERLPLMIDIGSGRMVPFAYHPSVLAALKRPLMTSIKVGTSEEVFLGPRVAHEWGSFYRRISMFRRVAGTPMWARLDLMFKSGQPHADFMLRYGNSNMADPRVKHSIPPIFFRVRGAHVQVDHLYSKVLLWKREGDVLDLQLQWAGEWGDGEMNCITGTLVFPGAELDQVLAEDAMMVFAGSNEWQSSEAAGLYEYLPPLPFTDQQCRDRAAALYNAHPNGPWADATLGLRPSTGSAGAQHCWRAQFAPAVMHGNLEYLYAMHRSVQQGLCRPTHVMQDNGIPYPFSKNPRLHMWGSQVWSTSEDKLGKAQAPGQVHRSPAGEVWTGQDRQHEGSEDLATYALITGDPMALEECQHQAEISVQQMRTDTGHPVIDGMGAARTVERTIVKALYLWLVTGREDLAQAVRTRVLSAYREWNGQSSSIQRPLKVDGPDGRWFNGEARFWFPWQELGAVRALELAYRHFGQPEALELAYEVGKSAFLFGCDRRNAVWGVYGAVEWKGGQDTGRKAWPTGSAGEPIPAMFNLWAAPALQWLKSESLRRNDAALFELPQMLNQMEGARMDWHRYEWMGGNPW